MIGLGEGGKVRDRNVDPIFARTMRVVLDLHLQGLWSVEVAPDLRQWLELEPITGIQINYICVGQEEQLVGGELFHEGQSGCGAAPLLVQLVCPK